MKSGHGLPKIKVLFAAVALMMLLATLLCACGKSSGRIIFVLQNGEPNVVWDGNVPVPVKDGFDFTGWFLDEDCQIPAELGDIFAAEHEDDVYIYAGWEADNQIKGVIFEDEIVVYDGLSHTIEPSGLPDGAQVEYVGEKYFVNAGEHRIDIVVKKAGFQDLHMHATLTIKKKALDEGEIKFADRQVIWDGQPHYIYAENVPDDITVTYDGNGQIAAGEYDVTASFDGAGNYEDIIDRIARLTILPKTCCVTFVFEDGSRNVVECIGGDNLVADGRMPELPEKDGYSASWSEELTYIVGDMTVYAEYSPIHYFIYLDAAGGTTEESVLVYTIEDSVILPDASRDYYTFDGWTDAGGDIVLEIGEGNFGDKYFTAKWTPIVYTITYDLAGGDNDAGNVDLWSTDNTYHYTAQSPVLELLPPIRTGFDFVGWFDEEGNEVKYVGIGHLMATCTLTAVWEPIERAA